MKDMFIDELIGQFGKFTSTSKMADTTAVVFMRSMRFQVDNVAEYVHANHGGQRPFHGEKEIPNVAPLAQYMWFEYSGSSVQLEAADRLGCLVTIDYERDGPRAGKWNVIDNIHPETRWILRAQYFSKDRVGYCASDWIYFFEVDESGQMIDMRSIPSEFRGPATAEDYTPDETQRLKWHEEIIVSLMSICFSHCKGTEIQEYRPSRQVRRAAERKGELSFSYHTIDIHSATRVLREEGDIAKNGLAKALHICRGHFAHYTAKKPLFGKYTGTFYRPMHVRGSAGQGVVGKGYRVHAE